MILQHRSQTDRTRRKAAGTKALSNLGGRGKKARSTASPQCVPARRANAAGILAIARPFIPYTLESHPELW